MASKISLLHVTADSSLLECKRAAQEFIAAADTVFFKAQGLAMLVPLHETAFSLLERLLNDWRLWNGVGVRMQKKHPPLSVLVMAKHIKLVQVAKAFLEQQGKSSQFFILEGYKGKGKAKALLEDSE
ncbi:hypothetical protein C0995_007542 [Termitomyces sp. Mi166|nr:hypothetical protein C0995_007542 [Termitomyces sp. Mi166\